MNTNVIIKPETVCNKIRMGPPTCVDQFSSISLFFSFVLFSRAAQCLSENAAVRFLGPPIAFAESFSGVARPR